MRYRLETWKIQIAVNEPAAQKLSGSDEVAALARELYKTHDADQEHFTIFTVNNKNKLVGCKTITSGTMTQSLVSPSDVFKHVLLTGANGLVIVHNHPSGDPAPSPEDIEITKRLNQGAKILGIRFLDHVIIGDNSERFFSFNDKGMM